MAVAQTYRAQAGIADRLAGLIVDIRAAMARRAVYAQTLRELDTLTNRELGDLGLSRTDIVRVAREAAYGK